MNNQNMTSSNDGNDDNDHHSSLSNEGERGMSAHPHSSPLSVHTSPLGEDDMQHQQEDSNLQEGHDAHNVTERMPIHTTESGDNSNHNSNITTTRTTSTIARTTTTRIQNISQGPVNFILTALTITFQICHFLYTLFYNALTLSIPTRQLYIISISLLCIHQIVEKVIECMPHVWFMAFDLIGHGNLPERLQNLTPASTMHMTKIDILEEIMESWIEESFANSKISSSSSITTDDHESLLAHVKKPLLSIMIPTTILSIFIVLTTTTFLFLHMTFQAILYTSSRFLSNESDGNNDQIDGGRGGRSTTTSFLSSPSSPLVLWGVLSILILETVLPWMCLCFGLYLSISVGGLTWCFFIFSIVFISTTVLRYLRTRIYVGFQEGFHNT